ncbi:MAG: hypothetical protein ACLSVD_14145 [Eggerthellaceae bacterium]
MIAAAYGEELNMERVKELAASWAAFACRAVARQLVAFLPALGWAVSRHRLHGHRRHGARGHRVLRGRSHAGQAHRRWPRRATRWCRPPRSAAQKAQATGAKAVDAVRDRAGRAAQAAGGVRDAAFTRFASGKVR